MTKEIVYAEAAPEPIGPYSQAVKVSVASLTNLLFVSGQIAAEQAAQGDIRAETQQVMENIGHILKASGLDYTNIVKSSIFVKDLDNFVAINEVYGRFFTSEPGMPYHPARETVEVARLPKDVNVEISVIAIQ